MKRKKRKQRTHIERKQSSGDPLTIKQIIEKAKKHGAGALEPTEFRLLQNLQKQQKAKSKEADRKETSEEKLARLSQNTIRCHARVATKANDLAQHTNFKLTPDFPERKEKCRIDLEAFCREYMHASFPKPFSSGHRRVIEHLQIGVTEGGKFLDVVYREFGKTTLAEAAVLWASAYGLRRYIVFIGADHPAAEQCLDSIRSEWENNEELQADFPEVWMAIDHSRGIPQKLMYQLYRKPGEAKYHSTDCQWTGTELVYPNIDGMPTAGVIVAARSIMGKLRGMKFKRPDGSQARPDLVIVDDPQDDESATSETGVEKRIRTIVRTVVNLSGAARKIAVVIPSTILSKDDVIDQLSNQKLHPTWSCVKIPFVEKWADKTGHDLWLGEYQKIMTTFDPAQAGDKERAAEEAKAFYLKNREAMDSGAAVSWAEAYATNEVSAIQHAYNKLIELGQRDFDCEFQGKPPDPVENTGQLDLKEHFSDSVRYDGRERGYVPKWAEHLTAFVDVQLQSLFWMVCAWREDFTGAIVDHGIFPEQAKHYLRAADVDPTLEKRFPGGGKEGRWMAAFKELVPLLLGRSWSGAAADLRIERLCIDANDGSAYDIVCDYCRASASPCVMPWRSRGVGASDRPFSEYRRNPGDKIGLNWRIPAARGNKAMRSFVADVNFWKSFVKSRLQARIGDAGCLTIFGKSYAENRLLVDHLLSEYGVEVHGQGRKLEEWRFRNPKNQENHWWDGLVACAALASACGCSLGGMDSKRADQKSFSIAGADVLSSLGG